MARGTALLGLLGCMTGAACAEMTASAMPVATEARVAATGTPSPSPVPAPDNGPQDATSSLPSPGASAEEDAERMRVAGVNALFTAVFRNETERVRELLAAGTEPNSVMPLPIDAAVAELFRPTVLNYFLSGESGLTPLMVAATLGHGETARILLEAGADRAARTKRHGTNALWLAGYKGHTDVTKLLLGVEPGSEADRMRIEVDLGAQTAQLYVDGTGQEVLPISSGRKGYATPKGEFVVTDKHRQWRSTLYGSSMPFYLRLSCRAFGLHAGHLPGYPASHGCIRLRKKDAQALFDRVPVGAIVVIK